jgi:hypothetical protein
MREVPQANSNTSHGTRQGAGRQLVCGKRVEIFGTLGPDLPKVIANTRHFNHGGLTAIHGPPEAQKVRPISPPFSPIGYGANDAPVAELARAPTNAYFALNPGEFSYEWVLLRNPLFI